MAQLSVISREQHGGKRWTRYTSYSFAAQDAVTPLVAQELPRACMHLPIGFVKTESGFQIVAVQGLQPGKNLWVAPDGRWVGGYVPASYRGYPFVVANTEDGRRVLCVREDSGLVTEGEGEPFFDEEGNAAKPVQDVLNFLEQVNGNAALTAQLTALLAQHQLIQPWPIQLKSENGEQKVDGLFRIDEAALGRLPIEALDELRKAGALPLIYCQLLSMQHLQKLGQLATQHAAAAAMLEPETGDLDLEFLHDDGNIRFQ
jgi:SapC.